MIMMTNLISERLIKEKKTDEKRTGRPETKMKNFLENLENTY